MTHVGTLRAPASDHRYAAMARAEPACVRIRPSVIAGTAKFPAATAECQGELASVLACDGPELIAVAVQVDSRKQLCTGTTGGVVHRSRKLSLYLLRSGGPGAALPAGHSCRQRTTGQFRARRRHQPPPQPGIGPEHSINEHFLREEARRGLGDGSRRAAIFRGIHKSECKAAAYGGCPPGWSGVRLGARDAEPLHA